MQSFWAQQKRIEVARGVDSLPTCSTTTWVVMTPDAHTGSAEYPGALQPLIPVSSPATKAVRN